MTRNTVFAGLTLADAHTTLGAITAMQEKAQDLSDEALHAELRQLTLRDMTDDVPFHDTDAIWYSVLRAERLKRAKRNDATL